MTPLEWGELGLVIGLGTVGQLALKRGLASRMSGTARSLALSPWIWTWLVTYAVCTALWLVALRTVPLSQAFPILGLQFALIPLASRWMLDEPIARWQWVGIVVIAAGTGLVGQT